MTSAIETALLDAYEPHVRARLAALGLGESIRGFDEALEAGQAWLAEQLHALLTLPFASQRRGPLEIFQESMRFPTQALQNAGVPPIERDPVVANALPGDLYGLAPAASHELGDQVWQAHMAWGASKAMAMRTPRRVSLLSRNLMDRSKLEAAFGSAGWAIQPPAAGPDALDVLVADLEHPDAMEAISAAVAAGARVVAFGPHVAEDALAAAADAGAESLPRSLVLRDPARFVAGLDLPQM